MVSGTLRIIPAQKTTEGAGANVRRPFPSTELLHLDPFVMLDEFFVGKVTKLVSLQENHPRAVRIYI